MQRGNGMGPGFRVQSSGGSIPRIDVFLSAEPCKLHPEPSGPRIYFPLPHPPHSGIEPAPMEKRWQLLTPDPALVRLLAGALNCHPVVATLLANRGLQTPD